MTQYKPIFSVKHIDMKPRKYLHSLKTPAATAGSYFWLKRFRNRVSPYDRFVIGSLASIVPEPPIGIGIAFGSFLQLLEVKTAKLVSNDYPRPIYAIGERGRLITLVPGQMLLTGMDGLAIPGQHKVYKCVDGCYYKVTQSGQIKLTRGVFQGLAHAGRGGGYKDRTWCLHQHTLGNPAWLSLYNTANPDSSP